MKASELIAELERLIEEHGDQEVWTERNGKVYPLEVEDIYLAMGQALWPEGFYL